MVVGPPNGIATLAIMASDDLAPAELMNLPSWLLTQTAMHAHRIITEAFTAA